MENLIPLAAYHADETGYWKRLSLFSGLVFGVGMAIFSAVYPIDDSTLLYSRISRALIGFFFCGIFFGLLFPWLVRRRFRSIQDGLFAGKSWIDEPPPTNRRLDYRFPCSLITGGGASAVGGVMYLGLDGMIFVPHKRNLRDNKRVLEMVPLSGVIIGTAEPPVRSLLQRILIPRPQPTLEVQWPEGRANFLVPSVESFLPKLSQLTAKLRA
jgi:flagellar biosynthesis protein FliQ